LEKKLDEPGSDVTESAGDTHYMSSSGAHSGLSSSELRCSEVRGRGNARTRKRKTMHLRKRKRTL